MLNVGITGGIGSGKSTVCAIFSILGIPIYNADLEAKKLYDNHSALKSQMIQLFSEVIYPEGKFHAPTLRKMLQDEPGKLQEVNRIVHPLIKQHSDQWFSDQTAPYAIKESALLVESLAYMGLDHTILVSAPMEVKFKRIQHRDALSVEEIEFRMKNQFSDEKKRAFCDIEIVNDEEQALIPQVLKIHQDLIAKVNRE